MALPWINFPKDYCCNVAKILRVSIKEQCEIFLLNTWPRRTKLEQMFVLKTIFAVFYSILALSDANQSFEFCRCQFYVKANFAESYLHQKQWQWHHEKNPVSVDQAHFDTFNKINFRWLQKCVSLIGENGQECVCHHLTNGLLTYWLLPLAANEFRWLLDSIENLENAVMLPISYLSKVIEYSILYTSTNTKVISEALLKIFVCCWQGQKRTGLGSLKNIYCRAGDGIEY